jgi:putative FmdB family regulatory protein
LRRIVPIVAADAAATLASIVPIYEFECDSCGSRFEELVAGSEALACRRCRSERIVRLLSLVAPPGRQPRGPKVRDSEAGRREREARRRQRLAEARATRTSP